MLWLRRLRIAIIIGGWRCGSRCIGWCLFIFFYGIMFFFSVFVRLGCRWRRWRYRFILRRSFLRCRGRNSIRFRICGGRFFDICLWIGSKLIGSLWFADIGCRHFGRWCRYRGCGRLSSQVQQKTSAGDLSPRHILGRAFMKATTRSTSA